MMKHRIGYVVFAVATACGASKSGSTVDAGPTGDGSSGPTIQQACADFEHAECEERETCSNHFGNDRTFGSEALCESRETAVCITNSMANGFGGTPADREECVADFGTAYPSCTAFFDNDPGSDCATVAGQLDISEACGVSGQCATAFCLIDSDSICGTCETLPQPGDVCDATAQCGPNLDCVIPTGETDGACEPYASAGSACLTGTTPCAAGLACVGDNVTSGSNGQCEPAGSAVGAPCDSSRATMANCNGQVGLACIPSAAHSSIGTCQAITLVGAGSACGNLGSAPITGVADCAAGGLCVGSAGAKTCVAAVDVGSACDATNGPPCLSPAKCVLSSDGSTSVCAESDPNMCTD